MTNHEKCVEKSIWSATAIVELQTCDECGEVFIGTKDYTFTQWDLGPDKYNEIRSKLELIADELNEIAKEKWP